VKFSTGVIYKTFSNKAET